MTYILIILLCFFIYFIGCVLTYLKIFNKNMKILEDYRLKKELISYTNIIDQFNINLYSFFWFLYWPIIKGNLFYNNFLNMFRKVNINFIYGKIKEYNLEILKEQEIDKLSVILIELESNKMEIVDDGDSIEKIEIEIENKLDKISEIESGKLDNDFIRKVNSFDSWRNF